MAWLRLLASFMEVDATISLEVWLPEIAPDLLELDREHVGTEVRASSSEFNRVKSDFLIDNNSTSEVDVFSLDGEFEISFRITQS